MGNGGMAAFSWGAGRWDLFERTAQDTLRKISKTAQDVLLRMSKTAQT